MLAPRGARLSRFLADCTLLILHAVTLLCGWARCRTQTALGDTFLLHLLGRSTAEALTPRALLMRRWRTLLCRLPMLRRATPPRAVTALVVTVRRMAPVMFPVLALMTRLSRFSMMLTSLGLVLTFTVAVTCEHRALPQSPIRRFPLLLPSGVSPRARALLGYALILADGVEGVRSRFALLEQSTWLVSW